MVLTRLLAYGRTAGSAEPHDQSTVSRLPRDTMRHAKNLGEIGSLVIGATSNLAKGGTAAGIHSRTVHCGIIFVTS